MRVNYAEMPDKLECCRPFTHRAASSTYEYDKGYETHVYKVYSYTTLIALRVPTQGITQINKSYYSPTTSRLQNLCIECWPDHEPL